MTRANVWTPRRTRLIYSSPNSAPLPGYPVVKPGSPLKLSKLNGGFSAAPSSRAQSSTQRGEPSTQRSATPPPSPSSPTKKGKKKKDKAAKPQYEMVRSVVLSIKAEGLLREAADCDKLASDVHTTFERRLGAALKAKNQTIKDLLA